MSYGTVKNRIRKMTFEELLLIIITAAKHPKSDYIDNSTYGSIFDWYVADEGIVELTCASISANVFYILNNSDPLKEITTGNEFLNDHEVFDIIASIDRLLRFDLFSYSERAKNLNLPLLPLDEDTFVKGLPRNPLAQLVPRYFLGQQSYRDSIRHWETWYRKLTVEKLLKRLDYD